MFADPPFKLGDRFDELHPASIDDAIGITDIADLVGAEAAALQAFGVDTFRRRRLPSDHRISRDVLARPGIHAEERVRADPAKLVGARKAREDRPVADVHVTRQGRVVRSLIGIALFAKIQWSPILQS